MRSDFWIQHPLNSPQVKLCRLKRLKITATWRGRTAACKIAILRFKSGCRLHKRCKGLQVITITCKPFLLVIVLDFVSALNHCRLFSSMVEGSSRRSRLSANDSLPLTAFTWISFPTGKSWRATSKRSDSCSSCKGLPSSPGSS